MAYFAPTPGAGTGASFTPGQGPRPNPRQFNPQQSEALKVLSLRLPGALGGRPIAPEGLLRPGPVGPQGPGAVGQSLLGRMGGPAPGLPQAPMALPGAGPSVGPSQVQQFQAQGPIIPGGPGPSPFAEQGPDLSSFAALVASALGNGGSQPRPLIGFDQPGEGRAPDLGLGPTPAPGDVGGGGGGGGTFEELVRALIGGGQPENRAENRRI